MEGFLTISPSWCSVRLTIFYGESMSLKKIKQLNPYLYRLLKDTNVKKYPLMVERIVDKYIAMTEDKK
jgi:hypothetical protein